MFKAFKNSVMSAVNFIDFLNHISISQWDVEHNQSQTAHKEMPQAQLQQE